MELFRVFRVFRGPSISSLLRVYREPAHFSVSAFQDFSFSSSLFPLPSSLSPLPSPYGSISHSWYASQGIGLRFRRQNGTPASA